MMPSVNRHISSSELFKWYKPKSDKIFHTFQYNIGKIKIRKPWFYNNLERAETNQSNKNRK